MFKYKVEESEVFSEVKVFTPDTFYDYRGEMWTFWQSPYNIPEEKIEDIKISSPSAQEKRNNGKINKYLIM